MPLTARSLASGSSGNSILVRNDDAAVLIDAGLGIRALVPMLRGIGFDPARLSAILITHEHADHIAGAVSVARRYRVPIVANAETLERIPDADQVPTRVLDAGQEMMFGGLLVRPFPVSHDAVRPVGYCIASTSASVCSATDTGIVTPEMRDAAMNADLLIVESNHDLEMLRTGPYPWPLKERVASDHGHLSNETTGRLLRDVADSARAASVWLAHLSRTNNSPRIALAAAKEALGDCLGLNLRVEVARRDVPSAVWRHGERAFQLSLFSGR